MIRMRSQSGFSLVELSIVLVILGLLTGGILGGQALIRAAELRTISTDFSRYHAAIYTFRDKYFALPGDMTNATRFWGDDNATCPDGTIANGTPGTCNGNGDGLMQIGLEMHRAWQQMALAGLIEGTYTGLNGGGTGCGNTCDVVAGVNAPRGRLSNGGYSIPLMGQDPVSDANNFFSTNLGGSFNVLSFGTKIPNFWYFDPIIKPEEAWGLDTKLDDGRPHQGKFFTRRNTLCTTTTDPATTDYALSVSANNCAVFYRF